MNRCVVLMLVVGCMRPLPTTRDGLLARRATLSGRSTSGTIALVAGLALGAVGVVLLAQGTDAQAREQHPDDEVGIGALLAGSLLTFGGIFGTAAGGIVLGTTRAELDRVDAALAQSRLP